MGLDHKSALKIAGKVGVSTQGLMGFLPELEEVQFQDETLLADTLLFVTELAQWILSEHKDDAVRRVLIGRAEALQDGWNAELARN